MQITLERFLEFTPYELKPYIERVSDSGYYTGKDKYFIQREILFYTTIKFNNSNVHAGAITISKIEFNEAKYPYELFNIKEEQLIISIKDFLEQLKDQL